MAITAKFQADFASFYDALQKAQVSLKTFETGAAGVEKQLTRMGNSFSGVKIIQDAHVMTAAMVEVGGLSKLTNSELLRLAATVNEASEKMRRLGQEVPPGFLKISEAARGIGKSTADAVGPVTDLHGALNTFDSVLNAVGIHITPEVRALGELGTASGQTVSQLGALATAGLAVGAGIGGWKIGRAIAEFFDLDDAISRVAAHLLGFGDVAAQVAGANADKLAEASRRAGHEITDMGIATAILSAGLHDVRTNAQLSAQMVAIWHQEIKAVGDDLPSLTKDLASQNFGVKDLAERYHVSVEALQLFAREQDNAAKATKDANAEIEKSNQAQLSRLRDTLSANAAAAKIEAAALLLRTKLEDEYYTMRIAHGGTSNEIAKAQIEQWAKDQAAAYKRASTDAHGFFDATSTESQAFYATLAADAHEKLAAIGIDWSLWNTRSIKGLREQADNARDTYNEMVASGAFFRDELDKQLDKVHESEAAARGMGASYVKAFNDSADAAAKQRLEMEKIADAAAKATAANRAMGGSVEFDLSTEEGRRKVPSDIAMYLHDGYSFEQAARLAYAIKMGFDVSRDPLFSQKGPRVPGFAGGVQNFSGGWAMVGEKGPEMVRLPRGSSVIPNAQAFGGGMKIAIYVTQPLGTPAAIASAVDVAFTARLKSLGYRVPSV